MIELMRYEWKKLFSRKFNYVMVALLLLLPFAELWYGMGTMKVHGVALMYEATYSEEGKAFTGFAALQAIDQRLHHFAGERTKEQQDQINAEREADSAAVEAQMPIDEEAMRRSFGEQWRAAYEKSLTEGITTGEVNDLRKSAGSFTYEVKDTPEIRALDTTFPLLYSMDTHYMLDSVQERYPHLGYSFYTEPEQYLASKDKEARYQAYHDDRLRVMRGELSAQQATPYDPTTQQFSGTGKNDVINGYLNQQFLDKPTFYDSDVAVKAFINIMNQKTIFVFVKFLLLGVMLLSVFNQEYSSKVDQVLKPMKVSLRKQAMAKTALILIICMGTMLYDLLIYLIGLQLLIGFHSLDVILDGALLVKTTIDTPIYTYREIIMTSSVLYLLMGLWITGLITLVSSFTKRAYSALLLYFLILSLCAGIPVAYEMMIRHAMPAAAIMPTTLFRPDTLFTMQLQNPYDSMAPIVYNWNYVQLSQWVLPTKDLLYGVIPVCSLLFYALATHHYQKREIQNA